MQVEKCVDGAMIMRPGLGRQRLYVASTHPGEVVILSNLAEVISCLRHRDEELKKCVPCQCTHPCYTQRTDRFLAIILRTGPTLWDERVMVLPAQGWSSLMSTMLNKGMNHEQIRGVRCIVQRHGDHANGRTSCEAQDRTSKPPAGFNLAAGVRNTLGIAADFFGDADGELFAKEVPPARTRQDKPSVALGRPQKPRG